MECYDPKANRWEFYEPMNNHEGGVGIGLMPMRMYGEDDDDSKDYGEDNSGDFEGYDGD